MPDLRARWAQYLQFVMNQEIRVNGDMIIVCDLMIDDLGEGTTGARIGDVVNPWLLPWSAPGEKLGDVLGRLADLQI